MNRRLPFAAPYAIVLGLAVAIAQPAAAQQPPKGVAEPHLAAGLRNADGTPRVTPPPHRTTGKTLKVTDFGADPADNATDDRPAIQAAIAAAKDGDEVFLPNGTYNLLSANENDANANIRLKSKVNIRGESEEGVKLVSSFDAGTSSRGFAVLKGMDVSDMTISRFTVTSTWNRKFSSDPRTQNPERGGPLYGIQIESTVGKNERITFENVTVERFARMAFRIAKGSYDVVIRHCTARNATDVAGGGAGYGFVFQGNGHMNANENPFGESGDNAYNVLEHSKAVGPYIRHGALIQYWAHNNVVRHNTFTDNIYDAIDLHGEDEYLNEIHHNTIVNVSRGAGIGLGNSGAGHDKTGPWNWVHHNTVTGSMRGLTAEYGTKANVIEDNIFQGNDTYADGIGISMGSVSNFIVRRNQIINNKAPGFAAIRFIRNRAEGDEPEGEPTNNRFEANIITGNTGPGAQAVRLEAPGSGNVWVGNTVSGNTDNTLPK